MKIINEQVVNLKETEKQPALCSVHAKGEGHCPVNKKICCADCFHPACKNRCNPSKPCEYKSEPKGE